ncbi:hypothetical protein BDZ94DRAFT_416157 [Collybia nuda]|uniref:DUF6534 domain-containing protein n=1 Tax=Collybia nuda TaxID=64659 RepID=A0A9P5Y9M1_9AGAR|nr:hypothetical protein BDZ94DRAFT_416157 [Collybia nuda]
MSSNLPLIPDNITAITAPQIIGTLFNWCLFGILSVQVYIYYLNFPDDKLSVKCLVYGTYLFEAVQTSLSAADLYFWFASGYGNMIHLGNVYISPWDTPFLCGIIAAVVQCFFAYRIWTLQRNYWWLSVLIVLTSTVQTAGAFGTAVRAHVLANFDRFHENIIFPASFHVWLLGDTVSDIIIAGSMLYIFHRSKKQEYQHANKILARLVRLIVETNTLTASMALLSFILYAAFPGGNLFICTTLIMGKLYSNTLLVTFNNRIALRKAAAEGASSNPGARGQGSFGNTGSAHRSLGSNTFDSTFGGTYRLGADRFQSSTKPQDLENIEIEVLKEVKVYGQADSHSSVIRCRHQPGCRGCSPSMNESSPRPPPF